MISSLNENVWENQHKVNHQILSQNIDILEIVVYFEITIIMF